MPLVIAFEEPSLFLEKATGDVTYEEVLRARVEMLADPRLRDGATFLVESKGVTGTPSSAALAFLAQQTRHLFVRGLKKMAIVSDSKLVDESANRFADYTYLTGGEVKVFRDVLKARAWLKEPHTRSAAR